jgi:Zn-dependent protease
MNALNSFLSWSAPAGRIAGISIRIHILFILYVLFQVWELRDQGMVFNLLLFAGVYGSILLHEFGHALSARWCGGEADQILIWPLGGLAYCRPPFHPTPHLISTVCGPLVTLVLWVLLSGLASLIEPDFTRLEHTPWVWAYVGALAASNKALLLFNLLPAFPLDGGRALRDALWHFMPLQKSNRIAGALSILACIGLIAWGVYHSNQWAIFVGIFAFVSGIQEISSQEYVELWQIEPWSLRERLGLREREAFVPGAPRRTRHARPAARSRYEAKIVPRPDVSDDRVPVARVDAILEKIARSGMESLTAEEREQLKRASTELKRQDG